MSDGLPARAWRRVRRWLDRMRALGGRLAISDREFYRWLDGDRLGLPGPSNGDYSQAHRALVEHLRTRREPRFLCRWEERQAYLQVAEIGFPGEVAATIREADLTCQHIFDLLGSGLAQMGREIDWSTDFTTGKRWGLDYYGGIDFLSLNDNSDIKYPWELSQHQHLVTLGRAYWYTGEERYAQEFAAQVNHWIEANPPLLGIHWIDPFDIAQRLVSWSLAYGFFRQSPALEVETHVGFLKYLAYQARFLARNVEGGAYAANHYIGDATGLFLVGLLFPEFREAAGWVEESLRILETEMLRQVEGDGVSFEHSTNYHRYVADCYLLVAALARANGLALSPSTLERLERMMEFLAYVTRPDGNAPMLGDGGMGKAFRLSNDPTHGNYYLPMLSAAAVLFHRPDFKQVAGRFHEESLWLLGPEALREFEELEASGQPLSSRAFPQGGFYVMRQGAGEGALGMTLDCGYLGMGKDGWGGHGHNDILSFDLYAYGRPFLVDIGTYRYSSDAPWRNFFRSTAAHNTVVVDGREMAELGPGLWQIQNQAHPRVHHWRSDERHDFFDGQHDGYRRLSSPVLHRRQVLFIKDPGYWIIKDILDGRGQHCLDLYFHFAPLEVSLEWDTCAVWTQDPRGPNLGLAPLNLEGLQAIVLQGWISYSYGELDRAPVVRYTKRGVLPIRFHTVIFPLPKGAAMPILQEIEALARRDWDTFVGEG